MSNYEPEWASLRITLPEGVPLHMPRNGDEAHKLACIATSPDRGGPRTHVDPAFFHHNGDGHALSGLSPIRFSAIRRDVQVVAVGEEGVDLLEDNGHKLTRALADMAGRALPESWRHGAMRCSVSRSLLEYRISHLVVTRKPGSALPPGLTRMPDSRDARTWVADVVRRGVERQAELLGFAPPDDEVMLSVRLPRGFVGWRRERGFYGIVAHQVEVTTNLRLVGPWAVGHLCLLGSGFLCGPRAVAVAEPLRAVG